MSPRGTALAGARSARATAGGGWPIDSQQPKGSIWALCSGTTCSRFSDDIFGIYRSNDGGANFTRMDALSSFVNGAAHITQVYFDADSPTILLKLGNCHDNRDRACRQSESHCRANNGSSAMLMPSDTWRALPAPDVDRGQV